MVKAGSTYRAVHAVSPGKLELTEKPLLDPNPGHVRIRLEACGVCHSDSFTVEGAFPIEWPRAPVDHVDNIVCELRVDLDFRIVPHEPVQRGHHEHADVR